uniref:4-hydroxy-3-methylbut-2-enyl diphosphate reductase n=1 Tax=candidate division WOR-3 bacterium TaxID=2052148 RepID=A0A7C4U712_UNCW3
MEIKIANNAGFCFGVMRALEKIEELKKNLRFPIYTFGPIIHNPQVVEKLRSEGVIPVEELQNIKEKGYLVIRSHGVDKEVIKKAERLHFKVVDATCPYVKRVQEIALRLVREGYKVIVLGDENHPEVQGILQFTEGKAEIFKEGMELGTIGKIGIVAQTTQSMDNLLKAVTYLLPLSAELRVFNTICNATTLRQTSARQLAKEVDVMIVVGGKNSANTTRLALISKELCPNVYHIETEDEIKPEWFTGVKKVGITAGASTPDWIIQNVYKKIKEIGEVIDEKREFSN